MVPKVLAEGKRLRLAVASQEGGTARLLHSIRRLHRLNTSLVGKIGCPLCHAAEYIRPYLEDDDESSRSLSAQALRMLGMERPVF